MSLFDRLPGWLTGRSLTRLERGELAGGLRRDPATRQVPIASPLCDRRHPEIGCLPVDYAPALWLADGMLGELKVDGYRAHYIGGTIVTREGGLFECATHCLPGLRRIEEAYGQPMFFDGEYVEEDGFDATTAAFRRGSGCGVFWLFDAIPLAEWRGEVKPTLMLRERRAVLSRTADAGRSPFVGALDVWELPTARHAADKAAEMWGLEYEGIMLKNPRSYYDRRRTPDWLRLKREITIDGTVMDVLAKGDLMQGLMVRLPGGSTIKVTAGFAEAIRKQGKMNPGIFLGQTVELVANAKAGSAAPRHARFSRIRLDKTVSR